jgi:hypothetical protein
MKRKYNMTAAQKEQAREFIFFTFMNKDNPLSYLRTSPPETIEKIINKIVEIEKEPLIFDLDNYIVDVYGDELYEKHKQQWEDHKMKIKIIKQLKSVVNVINPKKIML